MAAFFHELLDGFLNPDFLKGVHRKFRYGETQWEALLAVAGEMLPLMRRDAFWERGKAYSVQKKQGSAEAVCENVVISLGRGLDGLQEDYSEKGMLLESYMLETLASELLLQSYSAYNRHVRMTGSRHVARYHFPGSEKEYPLEMLPLLLKELTGEITCNEAFCMCPKKSVAFVSELTGDERVRCGGICAGCDSVNCPNRTGEDFRHGFMAAKTADMPLNYGYSRIFGKS